MVRGSGFGEPLSCIAWPTCFGQVHGCAPLRLPENEDAELEGIITVADGYKKSIECAMARSRLAKSLVVAEEKEMLERVVAMAGKQPALSPNPKDCDAQGSFQPAKETKKIPLDPENPERFAVIGANLDSK